MTKTLAKRYPDIFSSRFQIGLAFFAFILIGANDGATGVLIPSIEAHYQVDKGIVASIFFFSTLGYLVSAMNSGFLVSKLGNRNYLVFGAASFFCSLLVLCMLPPFVIFACMLFPLGFGVAIIDSGLNTYVAGLPESAAKLNYLHAFYGVGALLGPALASTMIVNNLPWNDVYLVWMGICLLAGIGFVSFFPNQHLSLSEHKADGGTLFDTMKIRIVWVVAFFLLFYVGTEIVLGSWSYSFLTEDRHLLALFAGWTVSGYWLGLTLGRLVLGKVTLWIGERRTIQWCLAGVVVGVLLVWWIPVSAVNVLGLGLTGFCLGPIFPTAISMTSKIIPAKNLASVIGFIISMAGVGGAIFPWTAGNLAQHLGLWTIMPFAIVLTATMLVFWSIIQRPAQKTLA